MEVKEMRKHERNSRTYFPIIAALFAVLILTALPSFPALGEIVQKSFSAPDEAVNAFVEAIKKGDTNELLAVLGPEGKDLIFSGDEVSDRQRGEAFVKAFEEKHELEGEQHGMIILDVGKDNWPFPIPIVHRGNVWLFDTKAGKEELINRRIGRNELDAIRVCLGYVDVQREYINTDWDGDGIMAYAQKIRSDPGRKNGLYWPTIEGEEESPLGPFVADAAKEGYVRKGEGQQPYHGYFFKILKAQGKHAPGGAYSYVINGNMVAGFALVAWPAKYGVSGVMTFVVNQNGIVYEKDLWKNTDKIAKAMTKYDPDKTWHRAE
jgi:hypothetical protein